jgi:ABC-type xylose transport system permease subunit
MLVIWSVMLVAGLWALFTGKLPMILFSGLGTHKVEGKAAKTIGICLALSALISFVGVFFFADNNFNSLILGLGPTLLVMGGATFVVRRLRKPSPLTDDLSDLLPPEAIKNDEVVRQKLQRSAYLLALGLGLIWLVHPIFWWIMCPLTYIQANRAISSVKDGRLIARYQNDANAIRLLSVVLAVASILMGLIRTQS